MNNTIDYRHRSQSKFVIEQSSKTPGQLMSYSGKQDIFTALTKYFRSAQPEGDASVSLAAYLNSLQYLYDRVPAKIKMSLSEVVCSFLLL